MTTNALAAATVLLAASVAFSNPWQDAPKPADPPARPASSPQEERDHQEAEETPLAAEMEKVEHAEHFLRRSIGDAAQDAESLKRIAEAQQAILAAKLLQPKMTASVPEAERAKFLSDYRREMAGLLIEFTQLERALLDGDREAAKASYKKLHAMEEVGHNSFTSGD